MAASFVQRPLDENHPIMRALMEANQSCKNTQDQNAYKYLLKILDLDEDRDQVEMKSYTDCEYRNFRDHGISFCFEQCKTSTDFKLASVHFYAAGNQTRFAPFCRWTRFQPDNHRLPYNIDAESRLIDIVHKFNPVEPEKGGGGRSGINIWIKYPAFGLMLEFPTKSWDDPNCCWSEITFFTPEKLG